MDLAAWVVQGPEKTVPRPLKGTPQWCPPLKLPAALLVIGLFCGSAHGWFGPSEQDPYVFHPINTVAPEAVTWRWVDRRETIRSTNLATKDGYALADNVFRPLPATYLAAEFARQVIDHAEHASIAEKLRGKTIELTLCEIDVGLWLRLSERQSSKWETVRISVRIRVDGQEFEALEMHPFRSRENPSPAAEPMREAAKNLVEQIHQLY